jgi:hypothetical protein
MMAHSTTATELVKTLSGKNESDPLNEEKHRNVVITEQLTKKRNKWK